MSERTSGTQVTRHGGKMKPLSLEFAKKIFAFMMQQLSLPSCSSLSDVPSRNSGDGKFTGIPIFERFYIYFSNFVYYTILYSFTIDFHVKTKKAL